MAYPITENKKALLNSLILDTIRRFVEALYDSKESEFNRVPFEGSWSPAEIGSHVKKSLELIHQTVKAEVAAMDRDPELHIQELKQIMEDMSAKGKSSPALLPDPKFTSRTNMRNALTAAEQLLLDDVRELDLSLICKVLSFPGIGCLTRYEIISFAMFHTARHARQLQNIQKALQGHRAI